MKHHPNTENTLRFINTKGEIETYTFEQKNFADTINAENKQMLFCESFVGDLRLKNKSFQKFKTCFHCNSSDTGIICVEQNSCLYWNSTACEGCFKCQSCHGRCYGDCNSCTGCNSGCNGCNSCDGICNTSCYVQCNTCDSANCCDSDCSYTPGCSNSSCSNSSQSVCTRCYGSGCYSCNGYCNNHVDCGSAFCGSSHCGSCVSCNGNGNGACGGCVSGGHFSNPSGCGSSNQGYCMGGGSSCGSGQSSSSSPSGPSGPSGNVICTYLIKRLFNNDAKLLRQSKKNVIIGLKNGLNRLAFRDYYSGLGPEIISYLEKESDEVLMKLWTDKISIVWSQLESENPNRGYKTYVKLLDYFIGKYNIDLSKYPEAEKSITEVMKEEI